MADCIHNMEVFGYLIFILLSYVCIVCVDSESNNSITSLSSTATIYDKQGENKHASTSLTETETNPESQETFLDLAITALPNLTENITNIYDANILIPKMNDTSNGNDNGESIQKAHSSREYPPPDNSENVTRTKEIGQNISTSKFHLKERPGRTNGPQKPSHDVIVLSTSEPLTRLPATTLYPSTSSSSTTPSRTTTSASIKTTTKTSPTQPSSATTTQKITLLKSDLAPTATSSIAENDVHRLHSSNSRPDPRKFPVPYFVDPEALKEYHRKHREHTSVFKHHLQIVPMIDTEYEPAVLKNHRYLLSILIPIGVGAVGALLIAVTVLTLRHIARKRPRLDNPFDDDVDIDCDRPRAKSRIASVCSETNDKAFLLMGEQDEE